MIGCSTQKETADLIVYHAKVYTVNKDFAVAEAFAVKDGKIINVGSTKKIRSKYAAYIEKDLKGKYVYPGLIDAHCHFFSYGISLRYADLVGTTSWEDILDKIQEHHKAFPSEWVLGRGWDQNDWKVQEYPTKKKLDELFPHTPVLLTRIAGHAAITNSEALRRAGLTINTKIEGGKLLIKDGQLTGVLIDNAIDAIRKIIPEPGNQEKVKAILEAQKNCFSVGLTTVHDAGLGYKTIDMIDSLNKSGDLKMRIYAMLNPGEENFNKYMYKGVYKTDHLNVRSIKLFADGALGSRGALLLEPYSDDPDNIGLAVSDLEFLKEMCRKAYEHNYQVNTHCIGDSANKLMLDIYGEILGEANDRRWRIEHAQVIHPDDFSKFGKYSIIPSIQTTHATSDMYWADGRLGPERIKGAYAYQQLLKENEWLPNGSDFPVESIKPLYGFYAAVARKDLEGYPDGGFQMENALAREQALKAMTIWAAKAAFEEKEKGSIEPGKLADFVVTDKNLMTVPEKEIPQIQIISTYLGGDEVYSASGDL